MEFQQLQKAWDEKIFNIILMMEVKNKLGNKCTRELQEPIIFYPVPMLSVNKNAKPDRKLEGFCNGINTKKNRLACSCKNKYISCYIYSLTIILI